MKGRATVDADERIRLFLALDVPDDATALHVRWSQDELEGGRTLEEFHITLAFLGYQPRPALGGVVELLRREAAATEPFELAVVRYRETRSVGMLVLDDRTGRAKDLADRVQHGLERLGVYERERRPWLPHVTVLRFRERPRLRPALPPLRAFAPSGAAALLSRLHPSGASYEVLESCPLGD